MQPPGTRTSDLQVIGVGFGRTGTASLKLALERLGFGPCYHMQEVMDRIDRVEQWQQVSTDGAADWAAIFDGFHATVDWPGAAYWRELVDAHPDAMVVLTVRDPQKWYDSFADTILRFPMRRHSMLERWAYAALIRLNPRESKVPVMLDTVLWDRVFGGRAFDGRGDDRDFAVTRFNQHVEEVVAHVERDRLLVFDVRDGWQPLCDFLGIAVPDEPFPRVNETEAFNRDIAERRRRAIWPVARAGGVIGGIGLIAAAVAALAGYQTTAWVSAGVAVVGVAGLAVAVIGDKGVGMLRRSEPRPGS